MLGSLHSSFGGLELGLRFEVDGVGGGESLTGCGALFYELDNLFLQLENCG